MEMYPKGNKETWLSQAHGLVKEAKRGNESAMHSLLVWLQDMNWPGANEACGYLNTNCEIIIPRIKEILKGDDLQWKYWIITSLISNWPKELMNKVAYDLLELTKHDDGEGVNLSSAYILCKEQLFDRDELVVVVNRIEKFNPDSLIVIEKMRRIIR
jgi:hypothetical protein